MTVPSIVYKAHGTCNDFVIYADPEGKYVPEEREVCFLTDRNRCIGGDGIIRLAHPRHVPDLTEEQVEEFEAAGVRWFMDYRNRDGSLAQMCGNGLRATAFFAQYLGVEGTESGSFDIGTRAGIKHVERLENDPVLGENIYRLDMGKWKSGEIDEYKISVSPDIKLSGTYVDMGNPHIVSVLEEDALQTVKNLDLSAAPAVAPVLESGQNVEFVAIESLPEGSENTVCENAFCNSAPGRAFMRVHERGVGETLSCGTGLCASAVTLYRKTGVRSWIITVRGGVLRIDVEDEKVFLTGSATIVAKIELL